MSGIKERVKAAQNQRTAAKDELDKLATQTIHSPTILSWLRRKAEHGLVRDDNKKTKKKGKI